MAPHEQEFQAGERAGETDARLTSVEHTVDAVWAKLGKVDENITEIKVTLARIEAGTRPCKEHAATIAKHSEAITRLQKTTAVHKWVLSAVGALLLAVVAPVIEFFRK